MAPHKTGARGIYTPLNPLATKMKWIGKSSIPSSSSNFCWIVRDIRVLALSCRRRALPLLSKAKYLLLNPLISNAFKIKGPENRERPSSSIKDKRNSLSPSGTTMTAGIVRIVKRLPSSRNTCGRATLTKKACAAV
ncbi:hypothetical protein AVEN_32078-1 [Araneus ventricosus]|uniref:Uncharacterized protein n=1 Tax=Araneus ventricosus TaxID=182803 RepID=A0A4Y2EDH0_ARAVE|nr:hypothetical protein AVEN_32078-1 [Araneus ventricosus]